MIMFSEKEANALIELVSSVAEKAKEGGNAELANGLIEICAKIEHSTIAGNGIPPETQETFSLAIDDAMRSGSMARLEAVFRRYMTAVARLEPDPAASLALLISRSLQQFQHAANLMGIDHAIRMTVAKLSILHAEYSDQPGAELVAFMLEWAKVGQADMQMGRAPWTDDEEIQTKPAAPPAPEEHDNRAW